MPRVGRHPLKEKSLVMESPTHQPITMTTITHIPVLEGYWAESLEVLKLFFDSLFASTELPFDLMVFDNGSCPEVQDYLVGLRREGQIQYLTLSTYNLRKLGALDYLLRNAPGEYVAYADSDVYFLPGWLDESIKVLDAFPEAGTVTAIPLAAGNVPTERSSFFQKMIDDPTVNVETGLLIPDKYIVAHQVSLGKKNQVESHLLNRVDVRLTRNHVEAYLAGADFQFLTKKKTVVPHLPLTSDEDEVYYDPIYSPVLEERLGKAGFSGFSTTSYLVHHMGNRVPVLKDELSWLSLIEKNKDKERNFSQRNRIKNRYIRKLLQKINLLVYKLLYE